MNLLSKTILRAKFCMSEKNESACFNYDKRELRRVEVFCFRVTRKRWSVCWTIVFLYDVLVQFFYVQNPTGNQQYQILLFILLKEQTDSGKSETKNFNVLVCDIFIFPWIGLFFKMNEEQNTTPVGWYRLLSQFFIHNWILGDIQWLNFWSRVQCHILCNLETEHLGWYLESVLFWYQIWRSVARVLALVFGLTTIPTYTWLKTSWCFLLNVLHDHWLTKVCKPTFEEVDEYSNAMNNKYPVLSERLRILGHSWQIAIGAGQIVQLGYSKLFQQWVEGLNVCQCYLCFHTVLINLDVYNLCHKD